MAEFRIEYTITRSHDGDSFAEVGFGSSGTHDNLANALYAIESDIQNKSWEVSGNMPHPDNLEEEDN